MVADSTSSSSEFPEAEVRKAIAAWWAEEQPKLEKSAGDKGSIMAPLVEIDSHRVARCLAAIEEATGIDIPTVEAEGTEFDSYEAMVEVLIPIARRYFKKQKDSRKRGE